MKNYQLITGLYLIFGLAWIVLTDRISEMISSNLKGLSQVQTFKGLLYVFGSAILIYVISRIAEKKLLQKEREKIAIYQKTVEGVHHIFLNYINQVQIIEVEAMKSAGFDKELISELRTVSYQASSALNRLSSIENLSAQEIHDRLYS